MTHKIILFQNDYATNGDTGWSAQFTRTAPYSDIYGSGLNDNISSIIVVKGKWRLYRDDLDSVVFWDVDDKGGPDQDGCYPFAHIPFENDKISSIKAI